jgi:uncharacterized protein
VTLILDTGPIVAALNEGDPDHRRCADLLAEAGDLLLPSPVLVEVDYWLVKLGGVKVWSDFVADIIQGVYRIAHPTDADLVRAADLEQTHAGLDLGVVDACTIALCERLNETKVATLDQRHFSVVRPSHCSHLTLLPE